MASTKIARGFTTISRSILSHSTQHTLSRTVRRNSLSGASDTEISSLFSSISGVRSSLSPDTSITASSGCSSSLSNGVGGVYFLKDSCNKLAAVFKPNDEEAIPTLEQGSINDNVSIGCEIKPGLIYGEGYLKEIAAYLLDKNNFHGVPPTTVFTFSNVLREKDTGMMKIGSLQKYISHVGTAEDIGWKNFPVDEVHKIGILDCRILNTDRHMGNILVVRNQDGAYRLVPIDHGLCLPSTLSGGYFEWLSFPQAKQPFSSESLQYIEELDVEADIQLLKKLLPNLRQECLDTLKICTVFLKKAANYGLNLYQIGCMMTRYSDIDEPSALEKLKKRVDLRLSSLNNSNNGVNNNDGCCGDFWEILGVEMDDLLYDTVVSVNRVN
jgi:hypothetical protein